MSEKLNPAANAPRVTISMPLRLRSTGESEPWCLGVSKTSDCKLTKAHSGVEIHTTTPTRTRKRNLTRFAKPDLLVANDSTPNYLYVNKGNGTFEEDGYMNGYALNGDGRDATAGKETSAATK